MNKTYHTRKKLEPHKDADTTFIGYPVKSKVNPPFFTPIQTKLNVGSPDSPSEKQADKMASKITSEETVQRKEDELNTRIQRQEEEEAQTKLQRQPEEEEEMLQTKLLQRAEEEEAQTKIMRQEEEEVQTKILHRKLDADTTATAFVLQPKSINTPPPITPELERMIEREKPTGFALPRDILQEMNQKFAYNFSRVKIHSGGKAAFICNQINAQAFTLGQHIFFNAGKYLPHTKNGKELLAHELTHIIQQNPMKK